MNILAIIILTITIIILLFLVFRKKADRRLIGLGETPDPLPKSPPCDTDNIFNTIPGDNKGMFDKQGITLRESRNAYKKDLKIQSRVLIHALGLKRPGTSLFLYLAVEAYKEHHLALKPDLSKQKLQRILKKGPIKNELEDQKLKKHARVNFEQKEIVATLTTLKDIENGIIKNLGHVDIKEGDKMYEIKLYKPEHL